MNRILILLVFISLSACQAPISYINNLPTVSGLEQSGDLNVKMNLGADWRLSDMIYDFDMAWSPISHLGIKSHFTALGNSRYFNELNYKDIAFVFYDQSENEMFGYEIVAGVGTEKMRSEDISYSSHQGTDHQSPIIVPVPRSGYGYNSYGKANKFYIQPSLNFPIKTEESLRVSTGLRLQYTDIQTLYYQNDDLRVLNGSYSSFTIDPFIDSNYNSGYFGLNTKLGYSLNLNNIPKSSSDQPVYKRFYYSIGVYINLKKREKGESLGQ